MFGRYNSTSTQWQPRRQPRALSPSARSHKTPPLEMDAVNLVMVAVDARLFRAALTAPCLRRPPPHPPAARATDCLAATNTACLVYRTDYRRSRVRRYPKSVLRALNFHGTRACVGCAHHTLGAYTAAKDGVTAPTRLATRQARTAASTVHLPPGIATLDPKAAFGDQIDPDSSGQ
jgi:hypothetical protein